MEKEVHIKRIQSRELATVLTAEELDEVSGGGCSPTRDIVPTSDGHWMIARDNNCSF